MDSAELFDEIKRQVDLESSLGEPVGFDMRFTGSGGEAGEFFAREPGTINVPRDEEQIAAEEGRVTPAQQAVNDDLKRQIENREQAERFITSTGADPKSILDPNVPKDLVDKFVKNLNRQLTVAESQYERALKFPKDDPGVIALIVDTLDRISGIRAVLKILGNQQIPNRYNMGLVFDYMYVNLLV